MTATLANPIPARPAEPGSRPPQYVYFEGVSWDYYERTIREIQAAGLRHRVTFDEGRMEIMTTGNRHERVKTTIGRLLEMYAIERNLPITGLGSVTCRRKDLQKGVEADECYYVQTPPPPIAEELDLNRFPPPDIAIEIEISRGSIEKQPIYGALGVPEIWRFDGEKIIPMIRQVDGSCAQSERSRTFPQLPIGEFNRFVAMAASADQHATVIAFRDWLRVSQ